MYAPKVAIFITGCSFRAIVSYMTLRRWKNSVNNQCITLGSWCARICLIARNNQRTSIVCFTADLVSFLFAFKISEENVCWNLCKRILVKVELTLHAHVSNIIFHTETFCVCVVRKKLYNYISSFFPYSFPSRRYFCMDLQKLFR